MNKKIQDVVDTVGGQTALAKLLGVKQQHVWNWINRGCLPVERAIQIEIATDGRVKRHELRPDIFDPPQTENQTNAA